jgi:hypothetical protein
MATRARATVAVPVGTPVVIPVVIPVAVHPGVRRAGLKARPTAVTVVKTPAEVPHQLVQAVADSVSKSRAVLSRRVIRAGSVEHHDRLARLHPVGLSAAHRLRRHCQITWVWHAAPRGRL